MTPDFKVGKDNQWFRQCVGIDIAKDKFNARLYMYDIASDMGCCTKGVEFPNNRTGFNQLVKWSRKEALGCKNRKLTPWKPPKQIYRELRQMTRFVEEINKVRTMLLNHLEALNHSESAEKPHLHYKRNRLHDRHCDHCNDQWFCIDYQCQAAYKLCRS